MGRSFSHEFLKGELGKLWKTKGLMNLIALGKGFYSLKCMTAEEKDNILVGGPWFLLGHLLWVQPWSPRFQPSASQIRQFPIWIHLPELPMEFFRREVLQKIGNGVGETLKVDSHSVDGGKRRYAAICTLVKEHKMLPKKIYIGSHVQALLYVEGPWWCTTCNHVGHMEKTCPEKPPVLAGDSTKEIEVVRMEPVNKVDWVPARRRRSLKKKEKKDTVEVGPVERWTPKKGERDPSETSNVGAKVTKNSVLSPQVSTGGNLETINPFHILQNNNP